ncbi:hypothetical protein GCM10028803_41130 [Larkinella knui]|uniref:Uncharacterized protein n=1 Tax=Larkinella knui TaxID=2025310 RepID=A0A3P1CN87_9BACT|nr:hypothetical protein [Larkinella knui]RRB14745.1 hypothetical protein EHT87_09245 [Larkinella knui]
MATLANTTNLLDDTIEILSSESTPQPGDDSSNLLQKWIDVLNQSENTQPLSRKLRELSDAIQKDSVETATIQRILNEIADATDEFSAQVGPEGELPSQLQGLAAALRNTGDHLS